MKGKTLIILPLILGTFMAGIDSSIVNVSLPTMQEQFNVKLDEIQWVITIYILGFCIFMPLTTFFKDKIGYYKLYMLSLGIFILGSFLCAIAQSLNSLIFARAIQAFGGGAITPTSMAIITAVFPAKVRGKVMGLWSIGSIAGPAIGPTIGGILTNFFGWPSIFYINVPIGLFTLFVAYKSLKFLDKMPRLNFKFDTLGFIWFTAFIISFQYAITIVSEKGVLSLWFIISFILSAITLYIFIKNSLKNSHPLFNLNIFKHAVYIRCILITVVRSIAIFGGLFLLPFLLQGELGFSEISAGLLILPFSAAMAIFTPLAGSLSDRIGPRKLVVPGLILVAISMFGFAALNQPNIPIIILIMVIRGIGLSLLVSTLTATAMSSVLSSEVTHASSMYTLMQQFGGSIGIAISGIIYQMVNNYYQNRGYLFEISNHYAIQDVFIVSGIFIIFSVILALKLPNKPMIRALQNSK